MIPKYPGFTGSGSALGRAFGQGSRRRSGSGGSRRPSASATKQRSSALLLFSRTRSMSPSAAATSPTIRKTRDACLSAGYHSVLGFFRDDTPLMELILDEKGQRELNRLWDEFDFIANFTARTWIQYFFNQSGEVYGKGAESGTRAPGRIMRSPTRRCHYARIAGDRLSRQGRWPTQQNDPIAPQAIRDHFDRIERHAADLGEGARGGRAQASRGAAQIRGARLSPAADRKAERDDMLAYYQTLRDKNDLSHEEAMRDSIVSVLMSPDFLLSHRSPEQRRAVGLRPAKTRRLQSRRQPLSALRSGQPAELFPVVQHARRGVAGACRRGRSAQARCAAGADPPHAERSARARPGDGIHRQLAGFPPASNNTMPSIASASPVSPTICARPCSRSRSGSWRTCFQQ